jgi:glycosyltransferase involved in cell wall biosynthesis
MAMRRLRVLQLGSPTGLYGAERWILALIKHLDPEKIESIVGVIKDEPSLEAPLCSEAERLGFETKVFEAYGRMNFSAVRQLRRFIREARIDILHTHWYKTDFVGWLAVQGTGCKIVSTPHGWSKQADSKLMIYEWIDRCLFPFFDAVAPLSEELFQGLIRFPNMKGKTKLIRNGVDISEIDAVESPADDILAWKGESFLIGYVGRLIRSKGLDVLLRAVCSLDSIDWKLAVIGDGDQRDILERQGEMLGIEDRVKFFGFRRDRIACLKAFDVFVLPSRTEGIPRCLMEAMAAGVLVVASDIQGCRVLIDNYETGILFTPEDDQDLYKRIMRTVGNTKMFQALGKKGKAYIKRKFSSEKMSREYSALYHSLLTESTK